MVGSSFQTNDQTGTFICARSRCKTRTQYMAVCGLPLHLGSLESRKTLEQKFIFQIGILNPHGINECSSFTYFIFRETSVFRLVTSVGQRRNSESPWGIEPHTFGFRALMPYHWATVSEVPYEVHITRVLHTARISNVNSFMFVNRVREMVSFFEQASCTLLG